MNTMSAWTIAFRKPRANRFQRVTNWHGTWAQAHDLANAFAEAHPELQVYYVVMAGMDSDTILVESGKHVRIIDNATLSGEMLEYAVSLLWEDAREDDAMINEAYAGKAEDAGMTVAAYRGCLSAHKRDGQIFLSGLWDTPIAHMHKVVTFDDGSRHGVSNADASFFTGEVTSMPKGEVSTCVHCKSVLLTEASEESVSEEMEAHPYAAEIEMLNNGINTLLPLEAVYRTNYQVAKNGTDSTRTDLAYQMWQDAVDAIAELRRTLEYVYTEAQNA